MVGDFKDMRSINVIVHTPAHDMIVPNTELKDRYLEDHYSQNTMYEGDLAKALDVRRYK